MNLRMKFIGALLWGEFMKFRLDPTSILRERARMAARFLQAHFAEVGQPYLREIVGPFVQRHLDPKISYEVDPARCKDAALRAQNMVALTNASEELFTLITSADSLERMPYPIRSGLGCSGHGMRPRLPEALPIVGGLIILKFFNPAVITPSMFFNPAVITPIDGISNGVLFEGGIPDGYEHSVMLHDKQFHQFHYLHPIPAPSLLPSTRGSPTGAIWREEEYLTDMNPFIEAL
ncbi:hypothetical protein PAPYR_13346 [Paratrimastix pyriformis]|uniref:Ras-GAP domain-containing protein n=1 Tax=Paratrimastix pyriformis TaxID=342808 RepID=A0ABQ8U2R5_9EUKA|nr:hypothetical protein PAPYR_13346 [Paratrimastix pyriformis]